MPTDPTIQCPECGTEIKLTRAMEASVGMVGEHKSRGQDLSKVHTQAVGYITDLINENREAETSRYIINTDSGNGCPTGLSEVLIEQ